METDRDLLKDIEYALARVTSQDTAKWESSVAPVRSLSRVNPSAWFLKALMCSMSTGRNRKTFGNVQESTRKKKSWEKSLPS